jgi:hypothetical protein
MNGLTFQKAHLIVNMILLTKSKFQKSKKYKAHVAEEEENKNK